MSDGAKKKKPSQPEIQTRTSRRQRQLPPEITPLNLPTRSKSCDSRVLSPNTVTPRLPDYAFTKPKGNLFRGAYLFPFAANRAADTRISKTTGDEFTVLSDHDNPKAPGKPKPGVGLVNRQEPENLFQFDDPEETGATPQPPSAANAADPRETKTIENEPDRLTGELHRPVGENEPDHLTGELHRPVGENEPDRLTGELHRPVGETEPNRLTGELQRPVGKEDETEVEPDLPDEE